MPRRAAPRVRSAPGVPRFISYYRVSTAQQGASGLGLEAQREAVARHVAIAGGALVAEFTEVESGKRNDRPQIAAAIAACRLQRATLVIAKLDRLARNVAFISNLMESSVDFVACDNPHATRLTIHILAAVAEHEREAISRRTKDALAVVRGAIAEQGNWLSRRSGQLITRLGNPHLTAGNTRKARGTRTAKAAEFAAAVQPYLERARSAGCRSLGELAAALTACGIETPAGGAEWTRMQVKRVIDRSANAAAG